MTPQESFRQQAPAPLPPRPIHIPRASETTLANGLAVVIVEDSDCRWSVIVWRFEQAMHTILRTARADRPVDGTLNRRHGILDEPANRRRSRKNGSHPEFRSKLRLHHCRRLIAGNLSMTRFSISLADVTLNPSFPENEVELIKQNTKESLRQQRAQPSFLAT